MALAARWLHVSQPALSRQIRELERLLSVQLFDRIGRRIALSTDGAEMLARSRRLLAEAESLRERGAALGGAKSGVLRVGATPQFLEAAMPQVLKLYRRQHPEVGNSALRGRRRSADPRGRARRVPHRDSGLEERRAAPECLALSAPGPRRHVPPTSAGVTARARRVRAQGRDIADPRARISDAPALRGSVFRRAGRTASAPGESVASVGDRAGRGGPRRGHRPLGRPVESGGHRGRRPRARHTATRRVGAGRVGSATVSSPSRRELPEGPGRVHPPLVSWTPPEADPGNPATRGLAGR